VSKPRTEKNWDEAWEVVNKFYGDRHMMCNAIVQLMEREKVRVLNNYLKQRGEPLISTDPPLMPGGREFEWIIDVPKEWYSLTGKDKS
jgi:cobyric acid synthase